MKLLIFTQGDSPETRSAKDLGALLEAEDHDVEYLEADSPEAEQRMELYDVYSYPTFVVAQENGSELECWRGLVPLESDLKHFLNQ
jgi:hypothetical protein